MLRVLTRLRFLLPYFLIFIAIQSITRIVLLTRAVFDVDFSTYEMLGLFGLGTYFDFITASFVLLPIVALLLVTPKKLHKAADLVLRFVASYVWLFTAVSEYLFWDEFHTRFNFIAVDYLVYTQEVIGNIIESYPVGWLLLIIGIAAAFITWLSCQFNAAGKHMFLLSQNKRVKGKIVATTLAIVVSAYIISDVGQSAFSENAEANELAGNGIYNLFYAYANNEISFDRFYKVRDHKDVAVQARSLLDESDDGVQFTTAEGEDLTRLVKRQGPEKHKNVIIVVMESMSAAYMQAFGNESDITPNLDALADEGLFFTKLYATGTRTVRGLEAVALSIPPTPGQSIVRRVDNGGLFSIGYVFKDRGYDTKFIYGGYGYFDNMNAFFSGNGFDVVDRTNFKKEEVEFSNIWGVSDEDLFKKVVNEADASYATKKPFMHVVMTTSNHRPYTYPEGRIDIPSKKGGRYGGVKYADYSVGKLIEQAKTKPWFRDTVFVFVADHTAGASGKIELDPVKYHIPMIFYAPGFIKPNTFDRIASQIDLAPTLLGQLNFSYYTKFYGEDVLHDEDEIPHAFISTYQKVGVLKDHDLTILAPKKTVEHYPINDAAAETKVEDELDELEAISYYQSASWWREQFKRIPTVVK